MSEICKLFVNNSQISDITCHIHTTADALLQVFSCEIILAGTRAVYRPTYSGFFPQHSFKIMQLNNEEHVA